MIVDHDTLEHLDFDAALAALAELEGHEVHATDTERRKGGTEFRTVQAFRGKLGRAVVTDRPMGNRDVKRVEVPIGERGLGAPPTSLYFTSANFDDARRVCPFGLPGMRVYTERGVLSFDPVLPT